MLIDLAEAELQIIITLGYINRQTHEHGDSVSCPGLGFSRRFNRASVNVDSSCLSSIHRTIFAATAEAGDGSVGAAGVWLCMCVCSRSVLESCM